LYQIDESNQYKLKEVETYYRLGYVLTDDAASMYIRPGEGAVLTAKRVGPPGDEIETLGSVFTVAEKIAYQIMVGLPEKLHEDSLDIVGHSLCRLEGRFDLDEKLRVYSCRQGFLVIDTLWSSSLRARLSGTFVNAENDTLVFRGDLKANRRK
jgi:hypothetical protein